MAMSASGLRKALARDISVGYSVNMQKYRHQEQQECRYCHVDLRAARKWNDTRRFTGTATMHTPNVRVPLRHRRLLFRRTYGRRQSTHRLARLLSTFVAASVLLAPSVVFGMSDEEHRMGGIPDMPTHILKMNGPGHGPRRSPYGRLGDPAKVSARFAAGGRSAPLRPRPSGRPSRADH